MVRALHAWPGDDRPMANAIGHPSIDHTPLPCHHDPSPVRAEIEERRPLTLLRTSIVIILLSGAPSLTSRPSKLRKIALAAQKLYISYTYL